MNTSYRMTPISLTSIASSGLSASYAAINTNGLPNGIQILRIISTSSTGVTISYDGTNDHDYLPAGLVLQLDITTNSVAPDFTALVVQGTIIYVKGTAGTGNIYLAGYYQPLLTIK